MTKWLQSVFLKRAILAAVTAQLSYLAAHKAVELSTLAAIAAQLSHFGVTVNVNMLLQAVAVDPEKMADALAVSAFALAQGAHEYIAARWPSLGAFL